jgi:VIT1/CCC1 family predicted Fe2+/Mn2+ transporter
MAHRERHRSERIGWLRAAVLGANDGIVSTASLVVGVAAAEVARQDVLVAGVAGLVAGALSMAAGEYVSVSSQADTEKADLTRERHELAAEPQAEEDELTGIYVGRGLAPDLARTVARQLTAKGALAAHGRDELGLTEELAALASAATFAVGAGVPIVTILVAPATALVLAVSVVSLLCLVALGAVAARIGGAPVLVGAARVAIWGMLAMLATAGVGRLFGTTDLSARSARFSYQELTVRCLEHSTVAELFDLAIEGGLANPEFLGGLTPIAAHGTEH